MTEALYASLCCFAGRWLATAQPWPYLIGRGIPGNTMNAVYIICDWPGRIMYVGSTTCGVRMRIAAHMRNVERTIGWAAVWIIPLRDGTPEKTIRRVEGLIGRAVRAPETKALPRIR